MFRYYSYFLLISVFIFYSRALSFEIDRVILSTNDNPNYIQFWPTAAKAWQEIVGVRPTLALIGSENVQVDTSYGDVIRFEPIEGIPTSFYAQCVRLLLPCLFPHEGCLLSDIDMMPLQKKFFTKKVREIPDDCFVTYRNKAYWFWKHRVYMCYNAAKGRVFQEIFGAKTYEDIPKIIAQWHRLGLGWSTDERMLYAYLKKWKKRKTRLKKLGYAKRKRRRIDRNLSFTKRNVSKGYYVEMNCPRPYVSYKNQIDTIMQLALLVSARK